MRKGGAGGRWIVLNRRRMDDGPTAGRAPFQRRPACRSDWPDWPDCADWSAAESSGPSAAQYGQKNRG